MTSGAPGPPDLPDPPNPLIHVPARLRLMATLAVLPRGDALCFTRLHDMLRLASGNLITHLRILEDAGYVQTGKTGSGTSAQTTVTLTLDGRSALERYTTALRQLAAGAAGENYLGPGPDMRIGDADRDAAAAALNEHFAQGRLTLDELDARLGATFAATTQREISQVTWDLPDLTVLSARPPFACLRRERGRRGHRIGPAASQGTPQRHRG